jgi:hypothetical protein
MISQPSRLSCLSFGQSLKVERLEGLLALLKIPERFPGGLLPSDPLDLIQALMLQNRMGLFLDHVARARRQSYDRELQRHG